MYRRLTRTVRDKGKLVKELDFDKLVTDPETDWYYSPFTYGEDAHEYFEEHKQSIGGYAGEVFTDVLYWDLDSKTDFNLVVEGTKKLYDYLSELGYKESLEVYFSGNKGVHLLLHTQDKFNPQQTAKICHNLAVKAGVSNSIFDTTVYNINRIFRVPFTKHPSSKLYKIRLTRDQLDSLTESDIRERAKVPSGNKAPFTYSLASASDLIEQYGKVEPPKLNVVELHGDKLEDFDINDAPTGKRKCIYALEQGAYGPGTRENAGIRLAAYAKGQGMAREAAQDIIVESLNKRDKRFPDLNSWSEKDVERILGVVYNDNWNGGTYSCRSDEFLRGFCGGCADDVKRSNVVTINGLIDSYVQYGREALMEYPKTGLAWVDEHIRIRPKNISVINGANGSGKTSFIIQALESLNEQGIDHLFMSLDMADTSLFEKMGARHTNYSQRDIEDAFNLHTKDPEVIREVVETLRRTYPHTYFDFSSSVGPDYVENTIKSIKDGDNPVNIQVVFIDYAGRLIGDKDNEYANATLNALKGPEIAKRTNTHLMYISQIPREDGDHTKPLYSSRVSKNTGSWEEAATFVINVWRDFGDGLEEADNFIRFYIAKNRSGKLQEHVYWWDGKRGLIREMEHSEFLVFQQQCEKNNKRIPFQMAEPDNKPVSPKQNMDKKFGKSANQPGYEHKTLSNSKDGNGTQVENNPNRTRLFSRLGTSEDKAT